MRQPRVEQMIHGYVRGHELLATSVRVSALDQDEITRLSDLSGNLLGDDPPSYLTMYPLPSGTWYAFARTWPDAQAARRGCVVTRTALVPMDDWQVGVDVTALEEALTPIDRNTLKPAIEALTVNWGRAPSARPLPNSLDLQLDDFVRRLFLEPLPSVIWPIEPPLLEGAERLTLRLVDFLWPARRKVFSACTYALQPRQISSIPFQVLFTPTAALSRFRAPQQLIVGQGDRAKPVGARGEHVLRAVRQVLNGQADADDWTSYASLKPLLPDQPDALLRLATLDDLSRRRDQGPNTLLAALDVWAGLAPGPTVAEAAKRDAAARALARADQLPTEDALSLLASLLQRLIRPPFRLLKDLRRDARSQIVLKSSLDVEAAMRWILAGGHARKDLMTLIARGIANAAANQLSALGGIDDGSDLLTAILAEAPAIPARYLDELPRAQVGERLGRVEGWITVRPASIQARMARELIRSPAVVRSELLAALAVEQASVADVASLLGFASEGATADIAWHVLANLVRQFPAAARKHYLDVDRFSRPETQLFAQALDETSIAEAIRHCAKANVSAAAWLALEYLRIRKTPPPLFLTMLGPSPNRELLRALWQGVLANVTGVEEGLEKLGDPALAADFLAVVKPTDLLQPMPPSVRGTVLPIAISMLVREYLLGRMENAQLGAWVAVIRELGAGELFDRVADNIALQPGVTAHPERIWRLVEAQLSFLPTLGARPYTDRVAQAISLTRDKHTAASVEIWARVVLRALEVSPGHREGVGLASFDAALRGRHSPVSPILTITFPVLHGGLPGKRRGTMFIGIFPIPYDIDKRKDARRELIDAFLQSSWPPGDLAIAAHRADVLPKILARLRQLRRSDYIQRMSADLSGRSNELARTIAALMRESNIGDDDS